MIVIIIIVWKIGTKKNDNRDKNYNINDNIDYIMTKIHENSI